MRTFFYALTYRGKFVWALDASKTYTLKEAIINNDLLYTQKKVAMKDASQFYELFGYRPRVKKVFIQAVMVKA